MNVPSHKSGTINGSVTQGSLSEGASLTSLWQKPHLKKNATALLCCLSMWKCNVRKGLNLQRTEEKEEKWQWRHWQSPAYTLTLWATLTHSSVKYCRERPGMAEGRHWKKDKRDEREEETDVKGGGTGAEHRRSERKRRRETQWRSYGQRERWHCTELQSPAGFFPPKWSDTACSPFSAWRPETAIICPINHMSHFSAFQLLSFYFCTRSESLHNSLRTDSVSSPRDSCNTPVPEILAYILYYNLMTSKKISKNRTTLR